MNGIMVQFTGSVGLITLSEISIYPVRFTLYIDKPVEYKPEGVEITLFSEFKYDDKGEVEIIIPKLESKATSCSGVNLLTGGCFTEEIGIACNFCNTMSK